MDVITWLQLVIIAVPFLAMVSISVALVVKERQNEHRGQRPLRSQRNPAPP